MIYSLQKKFIKICGGALIAVTAIIMALVIIFSQTQLNSNMDQLTDRISDNGGRFPHKQEFEPPTDMDIAGNHQIPKIINEETKFTTRYFTVVFDNSGNVISTDTSFISSVTEDEAVGYGAKALSKNKERGWISSFRYKVHRVGSENIVTFVDGSMNISVSFTTTLTVCAVLFVSFFVIFLVVVFFSKRAVKPIAESYEKQKQFITDANHELKTPLTLILANLDIIESEIGENEWLTDIRSEGERMSELVNQLVLLTRMDEGQKNMQPEQLDLSALLMSACDDFRILAQQSCKSLTAEVDGSVLYYGDKNALQRLFSILLDNAVKYCDKNGDIFVSLTAGSHPVICVENSYKDVNSVELNKLFDRFYRSDKSRTYNGSFGIGLSVAKAIVQNHNGKITAYKKDSSHIGFKVILK